ncbi:PDZ domain-containing protein [Ideonella sp. 3Y2]|uniref:PDZ domain-containing protein n=2 Tax=Ideonella alba TaxID=2824118 RepID=A0A940YAY0_9BURK|nr:PDZ domain-containing protein [Ideonella alba]
MQMRMNELWRRGRAGLGAAAAGLVLAACGGGGGGDGGPPPPLSCSVTDQKIWLADYMSDWYFWYAISPRPDPASYASVESLFDALLFPGNATFPADRWSYATPTVDYQRFFGDGQTLGFGVMVAGLEVSGHPDWPLYVRYIEPGSPAASAGVLRGDEILRINGRAVSDLIAANDFSALSATATGQSLTMLLDNGVSQRTVTLTSRVYDLVPVTNASVMSTPGGRTVGYLQLKDMVSQAERPFDTAFAQFRAAGVQDVVIDLRYNGGGLVSTSGRLASYVSAPRTAGQTYSKLLYNDRHASSNQVFAFGNPANALGLSRVYLLTGQRTCSASEQLINALRPFVQVVTVGDTSCGKPVGFLPQDDGCGTTWSVVNFESVNSRNEGRYFDGFDATCAVAEDYGQPLGTATEPLLATAMDHADTGACPVALGAKAPGRARALALRPLAERPHWLEPGDRRGMIGR